MCKFLVQLQDAAGLHEQHGIVLSLRRLHDRRAARPTDLGGHSLVACSKEESRQHKVIPDSKRGI